MKCKRNSVTSTYIKDNIIYSKQPYNQICAFFEAVAYPEIFFGGGVQQTQLTEGRENRDLGAVAP
jgi:hypothetical protein